MPERRRDVNADAHALPELQSVALLFTDIEGSTTRWETHPEAMMLALREHDRTLREAIESSGGSVFKTVGDAFYAVFDRAPQAVAAALAGQRALARGDYTAVDGLRVRMAVHVGAVEKRDGDYFGSTLNRVARLIGIAHGGQILLSADAAADAAAMLSQGVSLLNLGEHRLKDLARSERVSQIVADGLQSLFPPLRSLTVLPNNLPWQPTSFIGRDRDLVNVRAMLKTTRVLTILGAGGIGKTRVAIALGSDVLTAYPQGVFFVEFAPISEPHSVVEAVATALDIGSSAAATLERSVLDFLATRKVVLIFDNCEHLVAEIARLTCEIVRTCPDVAIVSSSREALRIPGERTYKLPSLGVPDDDPAVSFAEIAACDAVSLFVSRAQAVDHRFELTDVNAPIIADICRRVDGIALAIELAAARVAILSPESIRGRITKRLAILTRGNRAALPRQQTVRSLIDWSYDLLDGRERRFFERLSVFGDSFSLDAALAVAHVGDASDDGLDLLAALVDKSLVAADVEQVGGSERYRLLETLREYALEKLVASGEHDATMGRFAGWYADFVERSFVLWERAPSREWERITASEIPNVRAALTWLYAENRPVAVATIARSRRLFARIAAAEGERWISLATEANDPHVPPRVRAELRLARAQTLTALRRASDALTSSREAIDAFLVLGDDLGLAESRGFAGLALTMLDRSDLGEALLDEAIATYERCDAQQLRAYALSDLGLSKYFSGDHSSSVALLERSRDAFAALGNDRAAIVTTSNLAEVRFEMGDASEALELVDSAIAFDAEGRDQTMFFANKAMYLTALDRFDEALVAARAGLRRARGATADVDVAITLKHIAAIAALRGEGNDDRDDVERGARVFAIAERTMGAFGSVGDPANEIEAERARKAFARKLGSDWVDRIGAASREAPLAFAIAEASRL